MKQFFVLTLFPEMIEQTLSHSIMGRAQKEGHISVEAVNIRDFTLNKHKHVDDYPYGGGAGLVMKGQPIYDAYQSLMPRAEGARVVFMTPQGRPFTQRIAEELAQEMQMPEEKVREIMKIAQEPVSLETPIGEEEDSHLGDFIPDDDIPAPAEAAAFTLLKEQLMEVLDTLTDREKKVLSLRFGLEDGRARTLEEVGKEFNVTRERIRQIEAKALRKLRHPSRSKKLKDYLE